MRQERKDTIKIVLLALVASGICMIPCMGSRIPLGDDLRFHILRIESLYDAIKNGGGYPVRIYSKLLGGYGYGAGLFYPDLFLLPAVGFRFLGASPELAMKLYLFVLLLATCFTAYQAGTHIGKSRYIGAGTMALYVMGHYHLEDIYRRSAIGEVVAMTVIPIVFWALYDFTEQEHPKKGLLCIAFSALLLSHTISFVLCIGMAVVWVLIRWKKICNKRHIIHLLVEAGVCILVTTYYWIPVLEQFMSQKFYVSEHPAFETQDDMMTLLGILCGRYSISFAELGILVLLVTLGWKYHIKNKKGIGCLVLTVGILVIETTIFPWEWIDETPFISLQFPWRLNMFTEFFAALGIGIQLKAFHKTHILSTKRAKQCLAFCMLLGIFHLNVVWQIEILDYKDFPEEYIQNQSNTYEVGFGEWLPSETDLSQTAYANQSGSVYHEDEKMDGTYHDDGSFSFEISDADGTYIIPKYYYKGYAAELTDETGQVTVLDVEKDADTALVSLHLEQATGTVRVYYQGTTAQRVSEWISLLTLAACALACCIKCSRNRFGQETEKNFSV